ncbi:MAG: NAD(P)H-dependent oxidoreductase [Clostridia bacterium]|nr:NAD(P)H-dependent oxidoreductase [Clostridia bacterium]
MNKDSIKKQILDACYFRHACKEFDPKRKISDNDFNFILEVGRFSPSSFGLEPWQFLIIQNEDVRKKIEPYCPGSHNQFENVSHLVIILARKKVDMIYGSNYIKNLLREFKNYKDEWIEQFMHAYEGFQKGSFNLVESDRAIFDWSCKQTYIPLANMMSAAAQLEIDSCPMEGFDRKKLEKILSDENIIDSNIFGVSCLVSFGYRVHEPQEKVRKELKTIVKFI